MSLGLGAMRRGGGKRRSEESEKDKENGREEERSCLNGIDLPMAYKRPMLSFRLAFLPSCFMHAEAIIGQQQQQQRQH